MAKHPSTLLPTLILLLTLSLLHHPQPSSAAATTILNVVTDFGARPDGITDTSRAFLKAWEAACGSRDPAIIHVRKGRYLIHPVVFSGSGGSCSNPDITFRVVGSLVAPLDYRVMGNAHTWISFREVKGVTVKGGYMDARGSTSWACKDDSNRTDCPDGATTLGFSASSNIAIKGLTTLNSHLFHIVVNQCRDVHIEGVKVIAPGNSPNTDGIHVQFSKGVAILNSTMKTGDDCISIGPGTQNMLIESVACGPGHGISIGSLAKEKDEEGVQNVTIRKVVLTGTTNGLRIKSWARPSNGFVQDIRYENVVMRRVQFPIIIDQDYCPGNVDCPNKVSGIKIDKVTYQGIRGTSATEVAVQLECNELYPCTGMKFQNVNLTYHGKTALANCTNVKGRVVGLVRPDGCL